MYAVTRLGMIKLVLTELLSNSLVVARSMSFRQILRKYYDDH